MKLGESCRGCMFLFTRDDGYSNYTVLGVEMHCVMQENPHLKGGQEIPDELEDYNTGKQEFNTPRSIAGGSHATHAATSTPLSPRSGSCMMMGSCTTSTATGRRSCHWRTQPTTLRVPPTCCRC